MSINYLTITKMFDEKSDWNQSIVEWDSQMQILNLIDLKCSGIKSSELGFSDLEMVAGKKSIFPTSSRAAGINWSVFTFSTSH